MLRRSASPFLVLLLTLAPTLYSYKRVTEYVQARDLARFESEVQTAENTVRLGRISYLTTLRCLQASFNATPRLGTNAWKLFVNAIEWRTRFPEMLDLGYVEHRDAANSAEGWVVKFHESQLANDIHAQGTDIATDAAHRDALKKLSQTGVITTTEDMLLDSPPSLGPRRGVVLFLPVYEPGVLPPGMADQPGGPVKGAVFTSFDPASIYAGQHGLTNNVLKLELISPAPLNPSSLRQSSAFEQIVWLPPLGQKTMALRCTPGDEFAIGSYQVLPHLVLIGGLALSVSLFSLTVVLAAGRAKAEAANEELREAEAKITRLNEDLEQRIADRTHELELANHQLRDEVGERRRAELALHSSQARLRAMWEHAPEGIVIIDGDSGRFIDSNGRAPELFGIEREALLQHSPGDFCAALQSDGEPSAELWKRQMSEALQGGAPMFEWVMKHSSGRDVPCEIKLVRLPDADKRLLIGTLIDITARKQAEEELLKALHQEKSLSQLRSRVVNLVSHEFRTPLGIIMSSAEILDGHLDQLPPERRQSQLQAIIKATRDMSQLMEEVLLLGRVESGRLAFEPTPLNLYQLCQRMINEVLSVTQSKADIVFACPGLPETTCVDERLLRHIFINLLTNAVKYSPAGGKIRFLAQQQDRNFEFEIVDQGIGIHPEDLKNIFQAFHRGRNVGQIPGSGLGMVIVRRCAQLYGGNVQVESKLAHGTTVRVVIPAFETLDAAEEHGRSQTGTSFLRRDPSLKISSAHPGSPTGNIA